MGVWGGLGAGRGGGRREGPGVGCGDAGGEGEWDVGLEEGTQGRTRSCDAGFGSSPCCSTLPDSQPRAQGPARSVRIHGNKAVNESFVFLAQEEEMSRHV